MRDGPGNVVVVHTAHSGPRSSTSSHCPGGGSTLASVRFTAAVTNERPFFVARCLEVEVTSQGDTVESALANLKEALELYFEDQGPMEFEPPIIATVELSA